MLWAALLAVGLSGCPEHDKDDGTQPEAVQDLPALELGDDTPNLLLTWIDDKGETHTEVAVADVPADARKLVRVVVTDKPEGQGARFYVADLTSRAPDGHYPVKTMTRLAWEDIIAERRKAYLAKVAPPPPPPSEPTSSTAGATSSAPAGGLVAIVYGAAWCGPCHQAQAYLKRRGARVVYKDIDRDPRAASEMQAKLHRAGRAGAAIPVIDIGGQILVGFSPGAIDAALRSAERGTAL